MTEERKPAEGSKTVRCARWEPQKVCFKIHFIKGIYMEHELKGALLNRKMFAAFEH